MNDDEAKKYADGILARPDHGGLLEVFARHALQAIEDRTVLVRYMDMTVANRLDAFDAARRHMKGEE